mmetsp:Transcript_38588/g.73925  ORF Transcript_38588/g.73925 Transcript_38588/m.73925 type:complete len:300 (+) Transcript_38588:526-1425(+)
MVFRDLVVSGGASAFDLVRSVLAAFGLEGRAVGEEPWAASGRSAKAGWSTLGLLDNILVLQDVVSTDKAFATAPIEGLKYRDTEMLLVGLQELKRVHTAQLLDRPWVDTATRVHSQGTRREISLQMMLPEREPPSPNSTASRLFAPSEPCWYAFRLRSIAIGTKHDTLASAQSVLPRCVGGQGAVYAGNVVTYGFRPAQDDATLNGDGNDRSSGYKQVDDLNRRLGGARLRGEGFKICCASPSGPSSPHEAGTSLGVCLQLMRAPLFKSFVQHECDGLCRIEAVHTEYTDVFPSDPGSP